MSVQALSTEIVRPNLDLFQATVLEKSYHYVPGSCAHEVTMRVNAPVIEGKTNTSDGAVSRRQEFVMKVTIPPLNDGSSTSYKYMEVKAESFDRFHNFNPMGCIGWHHFTNLVREVVTEANTHDFASDPTSHTLPLDAFVARSLAAAVAEDRTIAASRAAARLTLEIGQTCGEYRGSKKGVPRLLLANLIIDRSDSLELVAAGVRLVKELGYDPFRTVAHSGSLIEMLYINACPQLQTKFGTSASLRLTILLDQAIGFVRELQIRDYNEVFASILNDYRHSGLQNGSPSEAHQIPHLGAD